MTAGSYIGFDLNNIRPPTKCIIVGLRLVLKFGLDRIYSFGVIAIFLFCRFGLKLPIHANFRGFGGIFPQITSPIVLTPKRHFLTRKHVV